MNKIQHSRPSQGLQPQGPVGPSRTMQWAIFIAIVLFTLAAIITISLTGDPRNLIPFSPLGLAWRQIVIYGFKRPEDFDLERLRILQKSRRQANKRQGP